MPTQILNNKKKPSFTTDDRIFLGEGLFETLGVEQRRPLYPQLHWQRMREAASVLNIAFDVSYTVWCEHLNACIQEAKINTGGVKVILSGGCAPRGLDRHADISSLGFDAFFFNPEQHPLRLISAPWLRDAKNPLYRLKSVNYLESILARRHAKIAEADDALFFNMELHATETTVANVFIIQQDKLLTPLLTDGALAGTIRARVLLLAKKAGISAIETSIDKKTIANADGIVVTNALQGMRTVKSFDGVSVNTEHPVVRCLQHELAVDEIRWG
jgi:4-amino-4-deoxychorismate lyase